MKKIISLLLCFICFMTVQAQEKQISVANKIEPLYVVDGEKQTSFTFKDLNPDDIETISVWKDKSAIERYGDEGKNGVIEIITKNNNKPLYMIDGVKQSKSFNIKDIEPMDIESISVWKGQNATFRYGEDGKHGVIEITTKNPKKYLK